MRPLLFSSDSVRSAKRDRISGDKHAQVLRLYKAFFNREPDLAGVEYWIEVREGERPELDGARDSFNIAQALTGASAAFKNLYGSDVSDEVFLTRVYGNVPSRRIGSGRVMPTGLTS